ncbi:MAG: GNAT family N-acetyltransferase [Candidatus Diapherotrites archaeon]
MKIELAEKSDLNKIKRLLSREFNYIKWNKTKLEERMQNPLIKLFKLTEEKSFVGFIELEFLDEDTARINGLSVKHSYRKKGYGKKLVEFALTFLQELSIEQVKLLVKKSNLTAKKLYESHGFYFEGIHHKKIDGEPVEIYAKELGEEEYLN